MSQYEHMYFTCLNVSSSRSFFRWTFSFHDVLFMYSVPSIPILEQKILKSLVHCGAFTSLKGTSDFSPQAFFRKMPQHIPPLQFITQSRFKYNLQHCRPQMDLYSALWDTTNSVLGLWTSAGSVCIGAVDHREFCIGDCGPQQTITKCTSGIAQNLLHYLQSHKILLKLA